MLNALSEASGEC